MLSLKILKLEDIVGIIGHLTVTRFVSHATMLESSSEMRRRRERE